MKAKLFIAPAIAVVLAAGAVFIPTPEAAEPEPPQPAPAAATSLACPVVGADATEYVSGFGSGEITLSAIDGQDSSVGTEVSKKSPSAPMRVRGEKGADFGAATWLYQQAGTDRGLSAAYCLSPESEQWFVGVRAYTEAQAQVELINLDQHEAAADLTFYTDQGMQLTQGSRGIRIAPLSTQTVPLSSLISSDKPLAIRVQSSAGRLAAFVRQRTWSGTQVDGADWIAPAAAPALTVTIPGVTGAKGELTVVNPSERSASVSLDMLTSEGVVPLSSDLAVPAGKTETMALPDALDGAAFGLRLSSDQPITAGLKLDSDTDSAKSDSAYTAALAPEDLLGGVRVPFKADAKLSLVNPTNTDVLVQYGVQSVSVPALSSVEVALSEKTAALSSDGPVIAALVATRKLGDVAGLAVMPIETAASLNTDLEVRYNPRVGS
ncbi:MAG: DUF5719 family protein [Propionibacteriaceae bacterium]|jgi:hypothetical protein|nr:DUF5719 family protein [Propionibacteriaceae bacterium]